MLEFKSPVGFTPESNLYFPYISFFLLLFIFSFFSTSLVYTIRRSTNWTLERNASVQGLKSFAFSPLPDRTTAKSIVNREIFMRRLIDLNSPREIQRSIAREFFSFFYHRPSFLLNKTLSAESIARHFAWKLNVQDRSLSQSFHLLFLFLVQLRKLTFNV